MNVKNKKINNKKVQHKNKKIIYLLSSKTVNRIIVLYFAIL